MKLVLFISYYFSKRTDIRIPLPQRFEKIFPHESKYEISNTSADKKISST